jgi:hypothetical protein
MRSSIETQLVATFRREMEKQFPKFSPLRLPAKSPSIWVWEIGPQLWVFIVLDAFDDYDQFAIEIAWSQDGEFPWKSFGNQLKLDSACWRGRLTESDSTSVCDLTPELTQARERCLEALRNGQADIGYPVPPPVEHVMPRISPAVDECFLMLRQQGWPILCRVAENRGLDLR